MNIGVWNVQGLRNKQHEVFKEMFDRKIDIAILSETKKKGAGCEKTKYYTHYYSGVDKSERAKCGISIIITRKLEKKVKCWEQINERIIKLTLTIQGRITNIIGIYAPNDDASVTNKDIFSNDLKQILDDIPNREEIILAGDFNARVGNIRQGRVLGPFGEERKNNNGERVLNLCEEYNLKIANSFFKHKDIHKYTWEQHTRGLRSIIDYIVIKQNSAIKIFDVRVKRGADCRSGHYLLTSKIQIPYRTTQQKGSNPSKLTEMKYNLESLSDHSTAYLYRRRLDQKLTEKHRTTEEEYQHVTYCIKEAAREALSEYKNEHKPYWWDKEAQEIIDNKKQLYLSWLNNKNQQTKEEYKRVDRETKKIILQKKNESWMRKCDEIDRYIGGTKCTEAWKALKHMKSDKSISQITPISETEWRNYFSDLLKENRNFGNNSVHNENSEYIQLEETELRRALQRAKNKKSPGPGGIPTELLKYGSDKLIRMLTKLYERCINGEDVPQEWRTCYISPIHKKGSKKDPRNYRGIAVICSIGRLYASVLKTKIENVTEQREMEEQSGFRAGRSTVDNIFTLKIMTEKRAQRNLETHMAFIDLEKAYDSVPIPLLWETMASMEISSTLIQATKNLYHNNTARVKISANKVTELFSTSKGLRQGCCLSPTLFKIYINQILKKWRRQCGSMGITVDNNTLFTLFYADDQIVVAEDADDLGYMVRKLQEYYQIAGLKINMTKSEYMSVANDNIEDLQLEQGNMRGVHTYKYLGVTFNKKGDSRDEIQERVNKGRKAIRQLNSLLWSKTIRKSTKKRLYSTFVESVTLYGAEVWDLNKTYKNKLLATEMDFWRRSLGVSRLQRKRNSDIRIEMGIEKDILEEIERRQLVWFGHVNRLDDNRWPKRILKWTPPQHRKRGRPKRSWRDEINDAMSSRNLSPSTCQNRKEWKLGTERRRQLQ